MSIVKKLIAMLSVVAMMFTMVACKDTTYAATSGDIVIPAGVYIYYQFLAYNEATQQVEDIDNFAKSFIEGKTVSDWIKDRATEEIKKYVAIEQKFTELNLEFNEKDNNVVKNTLNNIWSQQQKLYEKNGVGESSLKAVLENQMKNEKIFNALYGENAENGMTTAEIQKYFVDNYATVQYIPMRLKTGKGEEMNDSQKAEVLKKAEDYADRISKGVEFYKLFLQSENDYAASIAEANGDERRDTPYDENFDTTQLEQLIQKDMPYPSETVSKAVFDMKAGETKVIKDKDIYYVLQRLDINERPELLEQMKISILYQVNGEKYAKVMDSTTAQVVLVKNEDAYKRYDPLKLNFNVQ